MYQGGIHKLISCRRGLKKKGLSFVPLKPQTRVRVMRSFKVYIKNGLFFRTRITILTIPEDTVTFYLIPVHHEIQIPFNL